jgi:DNA polymerase III subunit epsilon
VINQVLIIDTETTALETDQGQVIEVGAILYSVKHQTPLQQIATLLPAIANPAEKINHIPVAPLAEMSAETAQWGIDLVMKMARQAEYAVAHNAEFDRKWFGSASGNGLNRIALPTLLQASGQPLPWICTCTDFEWSRQARPGQSLIDLALAHGIGVSTAHRALADCQLIAELFNREDNLQALFDQALRPKAKYMALVSYDDRHLAKQAGFKWQAETRTWERSMAIEDVETLPFPVKLCP